MRPAWPGASGQCPRHRRRAWSAGLRSGAFRQDSDPCRIGVRRSRGTVGCARLASELPPPLSSPASTDRVRTSLADNQLLTANTIQRMPAAFPNVPAVRYEGPRSKNPLAFKHYNADELVEGKSMREHLRFSVVYWHTMRGMGADPFGVGTAIRPWDDGTPSVRNAQNRARVAFEFMAKLGAPFYAFHDRDVAPEGGNLRETNKNLDAVAKVLKEEQRRTGIKLLWGTANLFTNPRYVHGAATSCNADVFAYAAAHGKKAREVTHEPGGRG